MEANTSRKRRTRRPSFAKLQKNHSHKACLAFFESHDQAKRYALSTESKSIMNAAHECSDDLDQIQMALSALDIYPLEIEALILLATVGNYTKEEALCLINLGLAAAEIDCHVYFQNNVGCFGDIHEVAPYMQALLLQAKTLQELDDEDAAIATYSRLLELDKNDKIGARFELLPLLEKNNDLQKVQAIRHQFENQQVESGDGDAHFVDQIGVWNGRERAEYKAIEERLAQYSDADTGILSVSGLDGFFTALVSSPSVLPGAQWMPLIFADGSKGPVWDSTDEFMAFFSQITSVLDRVADTFQDNPTEYYPLLRQNLACDNPTAQSVQEWCKGYLKVASLWSVNNEQEQLLTSLSVIQKYADPQSLSALAGLDKDNQQQVYQNICSASLGVYRYFEPQRNVEIEEIEKSKMPIRKEVTVGRNEPCPCGSGKKYKRCCLN